MNEKLEIVGYSDELAHYFHDLNRAWVEKYFEIEPVDAEMLGKPKQYYIDKGGHIFFAKLNGEVAGTFALMKAGEDVFELSKMAVGEKFQGKKIGNRMMEFCLQKAKELGAKKVILFSNTILGPAIHLYRKYGFTDVPIGSSEYKRSNIKMEVKL